jgi:hypothetical protein
MSSNPIEDMQYIPPSQIRASNYDDARVLHLAQTLYGEFAGVKDRDLQRQYMVMGASSAHNLFNQKEYKDLDFDTYLYKRFNAVKDMNQPYREALSGKFSDEMAWKRAMQIAYGTTNGLIKNDNTQFYFTPQEYKSIAGTPALPNPDQLQKIGSVGQYHTYRYRPQISTAYDVQTKLKDNGYYTGKIDGKIGPITLEAIRHFQEDNGLEPDGIVGKKTKAKLFAS